jgi:GntR family transcriptional regulator
VVERRVPIAMRQQLDPLLESMAKAGFKLTTRVLRQDRIVPPPYIAERIGESDAIFLERARYAERHLSRRAQLFVLFALS